jgi:hypothetical protein
MTDCPHIIVGHIDDVRVEMLNAYYLAVTVLRTVRLMRLFFFAGLTLFVAAVTPTFC